MGHTRITHSYLLEGKQQPICYVYQTKYTVKYILIECLVGGWVWVSPRPYFTGITFRFSSTTNTTQILQARKQMEYDNNEH